MITALVGFGQTLVTASATQRAMVTPLIEENRRALQELSAEYRSLNSEFFPTHVFDASDEPDPAFNQLLMADPTERSAISGRARYLLQHRRREHGTDTRSDNGTEALQRQLQEEIHVGLVGLFLARSHCTAMHVTLIADPPLDRVEMFDDSAWITLYSDVDAAGSLYPRTLRFSEGSFIYNMERAEFARLSSARSARHLLITPDLGRREFVTQFEQVTGTRLGTKQFTELAERFHHFRQEFSTLADLRS